MRMQSSRSGESSRAAATHTGKFTVSRGWHTLRQSAPTVWLRRPRDREAGTRRGESSRAAATQSLRVGGWILRGLDVYWTLGGWIFRGQISRGLDIHRAAATQSLRFGGWNIYACFDFSTRSVWQSFVRLYVHL